MTANCLPQGNPSNVLSSEGKAEAVVVVTVVGIVVVAIGYAHVPTVVVPAAAAKNAVLTLSFAAIFRLFCFSTLCYTHSGKTIARV